MTRSSTRRAAARSACRSRALAIARKWTSATPASAFSADALPQIFDRFYRVDPARSSVIEGAGLGLSLAKWIVDRHNGRIEVKSTPGKGSTFTVWLPSSPAVRTTGLLN
jgi:light-regulated signal transduction histidine kinase (bacteriophytochrome)